MRICRSCKGELEQGRTIGRREVCPSCRADLSCCLNCTFYDCAASRQCREPMAELVKNKESANFCDYFLFSEASGSAAASETDRARKTLSALFKK